MLWPSCLLGLRPVEYLWDNHVPTNISELWTVIEMAWFDISTEVL